ncbi:hypothetical protein BDR03DRAFT_969090 [Suillus americanus]|nr:hypothetical protein BDR03DRAFT_969090 [Suillus americanus]
MMCTGFCSVPLAQWAVCYFTIVMSNFECIAVEARVMWNKYGVRLAREPCTVMCPIQYKNLGNAPRSYRTLADMRTTLTASGGLVTNRLPFERYLVSSM